MQQQTANTGSIEVVADPKKLGIIVSIISIPVMVGALFLYPAVRGSQRGTFDLGWQFLLGLGAFMLVYIALIVAHELLHALGYKLVGHSEAKLGVDWKHMMAYAAAQSPMPITAYRWSVALPTLVLVPPLIFIGLVAGNFPAYAMGVLLFVSGFGDGWILWALRKYKSGVTVMDHPSKPGCIIYK
jgi:hypothetical protein